MKRVVYYIILMVSDLLRALSFRKYAMLATVFAHKIQGVIFSGKPKFIHRNVMLDSLGGLYICDNVVISTGVTILTHDYSCTVGLSANDQAPAGDIALFDSVTVGEYSFIGANTTILPGTRIGKYCIVGAGSLLKGTVEDFSIVAGNPAIVIADTREWGETILGRFPAEKIHYDKK